MSAQALDLTCTELIRRRGFMRPLRAHDTTKLIDFVSTKCHHYF